MIGKSLKIERKISSENKKTGYYSFFVKVGKSKKFIYLQTNNQQKESIENWKNNFSDGWEINNKLYLFSTEGISKFDINFENRVDYEINRKEKNYMELEKIITYSRVTKEDREKEISNLVMGMVSSK